MNWFQSLFVKDLNFILAVFNKMLVELNTFIDHKNEVVDDIDKVLDKMAVAKAAHQDDIIKAAKISAKIKDLVS